MQENEDQFLKILFTRVKDGKQFQEFLHAINDKGKVKRKQWTNILTEVVVGSCNSVGWNCTAKNHERDLLPFARARKEQSEYLTLDVVALRDSESAWSFPVLVAELETKQDSLRIFYDLWKISCIHARNKYLFCIQKNNADIDLLIKKINAEFLPSLHKTSFNTIHGDTFIIIGNLSKRGDLPHDFFECWKLDEKANKFVRIMVR